MKKIILLTLIIFMTPFGVIHAESSNTVWENMNNSSEDSKDTSLQEEEYTTTDIGFGETLRMILSLLVIIALILGIFYFIKKRKHGLFNRDSLFENIGGLSLGNQRSLQVIRMGERIFVIGVSDSIQLIKEIEDPQEVQQIIHKQTSSVDNQFATKFQNQLDQIKFSNKEGISKLLGRDKNND